MASSMAQLAIDFTNTATSVLNATVVSTAASGINATNTAGHPMSGNIYTEPYKMHMQLFSDNGRMFSTCILLTAPNDTAVSGLIYSNNFTTLYSTTTRGLFLFMPTYTAIIYFDESMNYLGNMQSGVVLSPGYASNASFDSCIWVSP